jgi:hypothetical protein
MAVPGNDCDLRRRFSSTLPHRKEANGSSLCDRPPGLSPTDARAAGGAGVSRSMNDDVIRRGYFPETLDPGVDSEALCPTIHSSLRAPRRFYVGQVANLRPIGKRPAGSAYNAPANASAVCGLPLCGAGCQTCGRLANRPVSVERKASSSTVSGPRDAPSGTIFRSCERFLLRRLCETAANSTLSPCSTLLHPKEANGSRRG